MKSIFQGSDILVHAPSLEPDEVITNTWVAAVPLWGIFSKHGGNLVLTNKRLLFEPLKIPDFAPGAKYLKFFAVEENGSNLSQISRAEAVPGGGARVRLISKRLERCGVPHFCKPSEFRLEWHKQERAGQSGPADKPSDRPGIWLLISLGASFPRTGQQMSVVWK